MKTVITGGAGFIGGNVARRLLRDGAAVVVVDNFSRAGTRASLNLLRHEGGPLEVEEGDVRDTAFVADVFGRHRDADAVLHAAAQVAVTTSLIDPLADSDVNVRGTLNVLEGMRRAESKAVLVYTSTNKVYGELAEHPVVEEDRRYRYADGRGVGEDTRLDLATPYGCSKGAADLYVQDYARTFGLRTVVFRNSCIYGPRQFGVEDQGWAAWFAATALLGRELTIYGDGKQVRDLLYVDDWVDAFLRVVAAGDPVSRVYNMGGGPENAVSIWVEFSEILAKAVGGLPPVRWGEWRPGDQRVYVSDISRATRELSWRPRTSPTQGILAMTAWLSDNLDAVRAALEADATA